MPPASGPGKGSAELAMLDSWALDIPGWGATAFEKGDTPGKWTSIGESGIHQVRLIREGRVNGFGANGR